jgi:hypothetical protein
MIAQKSATSATSLNGNGLVGNISATKKATKSYIIVNGGGGGCLIGRLNSKSRDSNFPSKL